MQLLIASRKVSKYNENYKYFIEENMLLDQRAGGLHFMSFGIIKFKLSQL